MVHGKPWKLVLNNVVMGSFSSLHFISCFVKNMRIPELNELNLSGLKDKYFSSKILIFGSLNFDPQAIFI